MKSFCYSKRKQKIIVIVFFNDDVVYPFKSLLQSAVVTSIRVTSQASTGYWLASLALVSVLPDGLDQLPPRKILFTVILRGDWRILEGGLGFLEGVLGFLKGGFGVSGGGLECAWVAVWVIEQCCQMVQTNYHQGKYYLQSYWGGWRILEGGFGVSRGGFGVSGGGLECAWVAVWVIEQCCQMV